MCKDFTSVISNFAEILFHSQDIIIFVFPDLAPRLIIGVGRSRELSPLGPWWGGGKPVGSRI